MEARHSSCMANQTTHGGKTQLQQANQTTQVKTQILADPTAHGGKTQLLANQTTHEVKTRLLHG
jgi:hypothetical protein